MPSGAGTSEHVAGSPLTHSALRVCARAASAARHSAASLARCCKHDRAWPMTGWAKRIVARMTRMVQRPEPPCRWSKAVTGDGDG